MVTNDKLITSYTIYIGNISVEWGLSRAFAVELHAGRNLVTAARNFIKPSPRPGQRPQQACKNPCNVYAQKNFPIP